jgi:intein-encoded DNA endonuclease-like protein
VKSGPPNPNAGTLQYCPSLWYVVGAILGDGYLYRSKHGFLVGLDVKSEAFAKKFASKESRVIGRAVKAYYYGGNGIWFVRVRNLQLFTLVSRIRKDLRVLLSEMSRGDRRANTIQFVSGFFDAEGCVKVVKGLERHTAKICLDITNTDRSLLEIVESLIQSWLGPKGTISAQHDLRGNRKTAYHLRFYRKADVQLILEAIRTPKLTEEKKMRLVAWLSLRSVREVR